LELLNNICLRAVGRFSKDAGSSNFYQRAKDASSSNFYLRAKDAGSSNFYLRAKDAGSSSNFFLRAKERRFNLLAPAPFQI
jgi:hypothetical protein